MKSTVDLREIVLTHGKSLLNNPAIIEYAKRNKSSTYYKEALEKYERLCEFEFSMAIAAEQSAGKTSILNTLLGFPLLPVCNRPATCVPAIVKYSNKIHISVENNSGEKKIIPVTLNKELFKLCLDYFYLCITMVGLENPLYFLDNPRSYYPNTTPKLKDLHIDETNPKHVAMIVLNVLCLYMDQEREHDSLDTKQSESLKLRKTLLKKMGLNPNDIDYSVIINWDSPILKSGLVFYDLPGLGASVIDKDGVNLHERVTMDALQNAQSMLYIFKPEVTVAGQDAINKMLKFRSIKDLNYKDSRFITVINKIDQHNPNAIEDAVKRAKDRFINLGLNPDKVFKISTIDAELNLVKVGGINPISTDNTDKAYNSVTSLGEEFDFKKKSVALEKLLNKKYNENSNYKEFIEGLELVASRGIFIHTVEFVSSLQRLLKDAESFFKQNIDIPESFILSSLELWNMFMCILDDPESDWRQKLSQNINKNELISLPQELNEIMKNTEAATNEKFEQFKSTLDFNKTFNSFIGKVDNEMTSLKRDLNSICSQMKVNIFGDIVLTRKSGQEFEPTNLPLWEKIIGKTDKFSFNESADFFCEQLRILAKKFMDACKDVEKQVSEENSKRMTDVISQFDNFYNKIQTKLDANDKEVAKNISDVFRNTLVEYKKEIEGYNYNTDNTSQEFIDKVMSECKKISSELSKYANNKLIDIKTHGRIFKSTGLVKKKVLDNTINGLEIDDGYIERLETELMPDEYFLNLTMDAKKSYKEGFNLPARNLEGKLENLRNAIRNEIEKKGHSKKELEHYKELLVALKQSRTCNGAEIDSELYNVNREKWEKNEVSNLRGERFSNN